MEVINAQNIVPGGLRFSGCNGYLLSEKPVEKCGFADVRSAEYDAETGFEIFE